MRPADGTDWLVGGEAWKLNPRLVVPQPWHDFVRLWGACRAGMGGIGTWPDAGGVADQAAWVVDAFALLAGLDSRMDDEQRRARGAA